MFKFLLLTWLAVIPFYAQAETTDLFNRVSRLTQYLAQEHKLDLEFNGPRLSENIRVANLYLKALSVMEELSVLYPGAISANALETAGGIRLETLSTADVSAVLALADPVINRIGFKLKTASRSGEHSFADVFQALRGLSALQRKIAGKQNLTVDWGSSQRVYQINMTQISPHLIAFAGAAGKHPKRFSPPTQPAKSVTAKHLYALQTTLLFHLGRHFKSAGYRPLVLTDYQEIASPTPTENYDLSLILLSELAVISPERANSDDMEIGYDMFRKSKPEIKPGDTYHLLRYNFLTTLTVLKWNAG